MYEDNKYLIIKAQKGDNEALGRIIEENTDYVFYNISDFSDTCDQALEAIYEDEQYTYYLSCIKSDQVIINFDITNLTMT